MALITLQEALDFLPVTYQTFTITAANDVLKLAYDGGTVTSVDIPDGSYDPTTLSTQLKTSIDTALSCTSTVTWSSTTYKFTIAVAAGHTIAYTHTSSDLGLTIGFNQDHAAALSITSDIAVSDPTAIVSTLKDGVEALIKKYCKRDLESTSYKERYDGDGTSSLILRQYPVTAITRLALWPIDVIRVRNTNTSTTATISVSSTALSCTKDGVTSSLAFATYTTYTTLVAAVNALGGGWEAVLQSSAYANYLTTELIERMGLYCLNSNWAYLQMPYDRAESDFDVDGDNGIINISRFTNLSGNWETRGFPTGIRNIFVNYTAGYTTIPEDLKMAVKITLKWFHQRRDEESFGVLSLGTGGISTSFEKEIPWEVRLILDGKYTRPMISSL